MYVSHFVVVFYVNARMLDGKRMMNQKTQLPNPLFKNNASKHKPGPKRVILRSLGKLHPQMQHIITFYLRDLTVAARFDTDL